MRSIMAVTIGFGLITLETRFLCGSHQTEKEAQTKDTNGSAPVKEGELA